MATEAPDLAKLRSVVERTRPLSLAEQRLLPLTAATEHLLPRGGLVRGSTIEVAGASGATTLALSLAAGPCNSGSWVAVVGFEELGWEAAEEVGIPIERLVAVRCRREQSPRVVAALLDSFDLVLCGPRFVPGQVELRKLRARARERGSVLMGVGAQGTGSTDNPDSTGSPAAALGGRRGRPWPSCDVRFVVRRSRWQGLGQGSGRLSGRRIEVLVSGRGELSRPRVEEVRLDAEGTPVAEEPARRLTGSGLQVLNGSSGADGSTTDVRSTAPDGRTVLEESA